MDHSEANFHYDDIMTCIDNQDLQACETLATQFDRFPPHFQNRILFEISQSPDMAASTLLAHILDMADMDPSLEEKVLDLVLEKAHNNIQFLDIYLAHAGPSQMHQAIPLLAGLLLSETDPNLLERSIRTIGELKDPTCIDVIGDFIFYGHDKLKQTAITALAEIHTPYAVDILRQASQTSKTDAFLESTLARLETGKKPSFTQDPAQQKQRASRKDTYEQLSDDSDLAQFLMMLHADSLTDQHLAMDLLTEIGSRAIPALISRMDLKKQASIINTLIVLSRLTPSDALPQVLKIINHHPPFIHARVAGYEAIRRLAGDMQAVSLIEGMEDDSHPVRIAAAAAADQHSSDIMIEGLKGRIEANEASSKRLELVSAIVDSLSENLFQRMLASDAFVFTAVNYLRSAPDAIRRHFIEILESRGNRALARSISTHASGPRPHPRITIFLATPSFSLNRIYATWLLAHEIYPMVFDHPKDLMAALAHTRPDLLITDPFLPETSHVDLAHNIRKTHPPEELPIIVFSHDKDRPASTINRILPYPESERTFINAVAHTILDSAVALIQSSVAENRYRGLNRLASGLPKCDAAIVRYLQSPDPAMAIHMLTLIRETDRMDLAADNWQHLTEHSHDPVICASLIRMAATGIGPLPQAITAYLTDTRETVRLAAAHAIAHNPAPEDITHIKQIVESADPLKQQVVEAIIDARALTVFDHLQTSDAFMDMASTYLALKAMPSAQTTFLRFLEDTGRKALARSIAEMSETHVEKKKPIVLIVDSTSEIRILLEKKVYRNGYLTVTCRNYTEALDLINTSQPDLLIMGLIPSPITWFQFIDLVDAFYPKKTLPILCIFPGPADDVTLFRQKKKNRRIREVLAMPLKDRPFRNALRRALEKEKPLKKPPGS